MLLKNVERYKVSTTKAAVTSFAGVPLLMGMAQSLGLEDRLNSLELKERERGYPPAENIFSMMGMLQAGGVALEDERLLSGDEGMQTLLGEMPAANTQGEFLRRFGSTMVYRLGEIQLKTAVTVVRAKRLKQVTVDVDAFFVESQKENATMNYEGNVGFCPLMVSCAELKMPLAGLFRPGHASPAANLVGLLERTLERLSGMALRVRSDSAGYQAEVVKVCERHQADFTITARKDEAVFEAIRSIQAADWKKHESTAWPEREMEIAETVHAFGDKDTPAHRLIVLRWPKAQRELWDKEPYEYHAILTSLEWEAGLVVQFHRTRQDASENTNKEVIATGLSKMPCRELLANAAFFQIVLLAATVVSAFKHLVLPQGWQTFTIQTLRFRLIRLAGMVAWRARSLWLKIPESYAFRIIFEDARHRILGIGCEIASTG